MTRVFCLSLFVLGLLVPIALADELPTDDAAAKPSRISYFKSIHPIFQAHCQGCHQPAKSSGDYVMTAFDQLIMGGESESAAIVPGKPDESYLVELITPVDGEAEMPQGKAPLSDQDVALIRTWIEQGALDDTPERARQQYDAKHPPVYTQPPVITSLDYSPDGNLLAVAGFHEVLLMSADGKKRVARLVACPSGSSRSGFRRMEIVCW